jgi:hypothetical protein
MPRFVSNSRIERHSRLERGPWESRREKQMENGRLRKRKSKKVSEKKMTPDEWDEIRTKELKRQFAADGNTRCEGQLDEYCTPDDYLTFAHTLKRRHIHTEADKRNCALLCRTCHLKLELMGEARMKRQIEKIIERRVFRLAEAEAA